jgi:hypothetical protein
MSTNQQTNPSPEDLPLFALYPKTIAHVIQNLRTYAILLELAPSTWTAMPAAIDKQHPAIISHPQAPHISGSIYTQIFGPGDSDLERRLIRESNCRLSETPTPDICTFLLFFAEFLESSFPTPESQSVPIPFFPRDL